MLYFAYAPEHDVRALVRWANARSLPSIDWTLFGPALLRDADLIFPEYDAISGGGHAAAHESPGRRVAGVVYEIGEKSLPVLEAFIRHVYADVETADRLKLRRAQGRATRTGDGEPFDVTYYAAHQHDGRPVPPTPDYVRELATFAMRHGHSHTWLMHLLSVPTTEGKVEPISYDI